MESWGMYWSTHFEGCQEGCSQLKEEKHKVTTDTIHNCNNKRMKIEQRRPHDCIYKWKCSQKDDIMSMKEPSIIARPRGINQHLRKVQYIILVLLFQTLQHRTHILNSVGEALSSLVSLESGCLSTLDTVVYLHASGWVPIRTQVRDPFRVWLHSLIR